MCPSVPVRTANVGILRSLVDTRRTLHLPAQSPGQAHMPERPSKGGPPSALVETSCANAFANESDCDVARGRDVRDGHQPSGPGERGVRENWETRKTHVVLLITQRPTARSRSSYPCYPAGGTILVLCAAEILHSSFLHTMMSVKIVCRTWSGARPCTSPARPGSFAAAAVHSRRKAPPLPSHKARVSPHGRARRR
jgi:hypothetical protein